MATCRAWRLSQSLRLTSASADLRRSLPERCVPPHLPKPPTGRTIVIGAGKASAAMARAVEQHWPGPLSGLVKALGAMLPALHGPVIPALACLAAAALLLLLEAREGAGAMEVASLLVLLPLAGVVATAPHVEAAWPALAVALVVAVLARHREDLLHSECGIKLLWVMGAALALSWGGLELLAISTGTRALAEQWAVLRLDLESSIGWSTALSLSLLVGVVMLGGAPFHFWPADLFQGARPWLAPLAVAGIQVCGAGWLLSRVDGIEQFPTGQRIVYSLLGA